MTRAQITRFKKVGRFRVFQNWTDEGRAKEFARINLIYGTNGSGKSTLASLLRECARSTPEGASANVELDVIIGGDSTTITQSSEGFWARVRVFNADYVRENLRFDDAAGPHSDSLLTLGKVNVDAERQLEDARDRRSALEPEAAEARATATAAESAIQQRMTEVAGFVVDDLRTSPDARYRGTNVYTRRNVRALLEGDRSTLGGASNDVAADRAVATSDARAPYSSLAQPRLPTIAQLLDESFALLETDVTSQPLDDLANDSALAQWVQEGLSLHEHSSVCSFCASVISPERRAELAAHFDRSLTELQSRIDSQLMLLERARNDSNVMNASIPRDGDLYPELAGELRDARDAVRTQIDQFQRVLSQLGDALAAKRSNPFKPSLLFPRTITIPSLDPVRAVVELHEKRRQEHAASASAAARRVELARVRAIVPEYDASAKQLRELQDRASQLEDEVRTLSDTIITLSNLDADPVPQAAELTDSVSRLLGRADLAFKTSADGKQYRIERAGSPATHLSEGERTAIALLHFLASIREGVIADDEPIVVIDDPVSSMDDGILFGVSSFLWSSLVESSHASQVLLLTHNFELFRQWVTQLESAARFIAGGYTIHEIRMRHRSRGDAVPRRLPQFDPWTADRQQSSRLRSLYHFLFARVAHAVIDATPEVGLAERMDILALAPNAARKMIEAFLSFRFPQHIGSFHNGMKAAISEVDDHAIRTHVERYLHAYSHNEEGNVSAMLDPSEATVVLRSVFAMMRANDPKHFSAMCAALGIDETALFALPN